MVNNGDIFVATWGYEQTNADFYQVIAVTPKGVRIRHIKSKEKTEGSSMSGYAVPIKDAFDGSPKTKRITIYDGEENIRIDSSQGLANKWDGNPVGISTYG